MCLPPPYLPRWRPAAARTVREALAAMGALARDAVIRGAAPMRMDTALLTETAGAPLKRLGLDRAAEVVEGLRAWVGSPSPQYVRELLRAMLLARMGARFPDGPAPAAVLEPLLRARRPLAGQAIWRGRVLSPLSVTQGQGLVWEVGSSRVMRVTNPDLIGERALLVRSMRVDPGHPTPLATVGHVTHGSTALACDWRMLRHAAASFEEVGLAHAAELGDPFLRDPAPVLVGPFRFVRRTTEGGLWAIVEDQHGVRASLRFSGKLLESGAASARLHALVRPVARQGQLTLIPHLIWINGLRHPGYAAPVGGAPWEDGVVHELGERLLRVIANGLDANYSVRAEVRRMVPHLDAAGFPRLARMASQAFPPDRPADPLQFVLAAHMTHAVLAGPRWVQLAETA